MLKYHILNSLALDTYICILSFNSSFFLGLHFLPFSLCSAYQFTFTLLEVFII